MCQAFYIHDFPTEPSQPPREPALCRCGWLGGNSTPGCGPSGLSLPWRNLGSGNCGEGEERCSFRRARPRGRQPGVPEGSSREGSNSCRCRARGPRLRWADPAPGPRGGAARGGARGAGRRRGGGTGGSGSARRGSPAPRAASVWRRRARRSRGAKSGERGPRAAAAPSCHRPAREPAAAADGVHLSCDPAGEAGAREPSAGRSPASPGRSPASPQAPARGAAASRSAVAAPPGPRAGEIRTKSRLPERLPPAPRRAQDQAARGAAGEAGPAVGEPRAAAGEKPPRALLLLPLPPPSLRTWSPLSCRRRRRRRLALSSARRGGGSGRSCLPHPPAGRPGTRLASSRRASPAPRAAGAAARQWRARAGRSRRARSSRRPGPRPRWMCARGAGSPRRRSCCPVRIWFGASALGLWRRRSPETCGRSPVESWAFSLRVFWWFPPWSLTIALREPC